MGCDIHVFVEIKNDGQWTMVREVGRDMPGAERDYRLFATVASVRAGVGNPAGAVPFGLPEDLSASVAYHANRCPDYHGHSHMTLEQACRYWIAGDSIADDYYAMKFPEYHYFGIDLESDPGEYRIVFWFEN